jgi:hypothetical protein
LEFQLHGTGKNSNSPFEIEEEEKNGLIDKKSRKSFPSRSAEMKASPPYLDNYSQTMVLSNHNI